MAGVKQVRNKKLLPDLRKEGHLSKDIVLSTTEKHGVSTGSRLFSHHTLASVRKLYFYHPFAIPDDSLDIVLASTYDHSMDHFADKEDLYLQPETIGCETWRLLRNTIGKRPTSSIPLHIRYNLANVFSREGTLMEYMETRELHPTKKAKRVRSWYLYEQYKSLENSQIDGAQLLKDRPCQEKILHQELEERRARRQLCDQLASCQSECRHWPSSMTSDTGTLTSVSTDDFIDNFCEFQESNATIVNSDKTYSLYYDQHKYDDENDNKAIITYGEESLANSLAEKEIDSNSYLKSELEVVKQNIEDSFNLQLETMKENIQCLEKYATQSYEDKATGELNVKSLKQCKTHKSTEYDNSLFVVWSRLVSFAYQVIRLNRGNCYYDYSTQFMAAVLVCDILCKGVSKMCDILQPYVSPIKFTTDDTDACNDSYVKKNYTISSYSKGSRRSSKNKSRPSKSQIPRPQDGKNNRCKLKRGSQVYDHLRVATFSPRIRLHNSVTTHRLHEGLSRRKHSCSENCSCLNKIVNPMIKLSRYIDSVLKDLED